MTKEELIIKNLLELTQDEKIKWTKFFIGSGHKYKTSLGNDAFELFYFNNGSKEISLQFVHKHITEIDKQHSIKSSLLKDLLNAITHDEREKEKQEREIGLEKAYSAIVDFADNLIDKEINE